VVLALMVAYIPHRNSWLVQVAFNKEFHSEAVKLFFYILDVNVRYQKIRTVDK